jgi:hypothetical protein
MPFPASLGNVLTDNPIMTAAIAAATVEAQAVFPDSFAPARAAFSIVAIDESTDPPGFLHGGLRHTQMHYSASLLKVAAMYAAYQLRQSANNFASSVADATADDLFNHMSASFDPLIAPAVPLISSNPQITQAMKVPKYRSVFAAVPLVDGGFSLFFNLVFQNNLRQMIVPSNNNAAGACIQALGYSWINGVLASAGFFNSATNAGIWLAGTFTAAFPPVRVASVNDGPVAQATTTFDLANFYAHMFRHTLVDAGSSDEMLALLDDAAAGPDPSWMVRPGIAPADISFGVTETKIGLGPLKPVSGGFDVASEGTIVQHFDTGRKFIVVWQNCRDDGDSLAACALIVNRAINIFLAVP